MHHIAHEQGASSYRFCSALLPHGDGCKTHIGVDVQRSGAVLGEEFTVAALELGGVAPAQREGEFTPFVVRINRDQRVIEIE